MTLNIKLQCRPLSAWSTTQLSHSPCTRYRGCLMHLHLSNWSEFCRQHVTLRVFAITTLSTASVPSLHMLYLYQTHALTLNHNERDGPRRLEGFVSPENLRRLCVSRWSVLSVYLCFWIVLHLYYFVNYRLLQPVIRPDHLVCSFHYSGSSLFTSLSLFTCFDEPRASWLWICECKGWRLRDCW